MSTPSPIEAARLALERIAQIAGDNATPGYNLEGRLSRCQTIARDAYNALTEDGGEDGDAVDGLKPCPFCGGKAILNEARDFRRYSTGAFETGIAVYCASCGVEQLICRSDVPDIQPEEVIAAWNRRVSPTPAEPGPMREETGWFVELIQDQRPPSYFAGPTIGDPTKWPYCLITGDHLQAVRFMRKVDAQRVIDAMHAANPYGAVDLCFRTSEHQWCALPSLAGGNGSGAASPIPPMREAVAKAIAMSYGVDPDDDAPISVMCNADNSPVPWWMVYEEQAEAAILTLVGGDHRLEDAR